MYPQIELGWVTFYMTWAAIIFFILSNIFLISFYSKRFNVNFWKFFNWLPVFLILPYILWSYIYHLFSSLLIIPLNFNDLLLILSPYWYDFSFIWISLWLFIAISLFIKNIEVKIEKYKRIDIFFYSISLSLVPLWMLLLLWDDFIWKPTGSALWMTAFSQDSIIYNYEKVYPVWLFLAIAWILSFIVWLFLNYATKKHWIWFLGFIMLLLILNIVFYYQLYPKYFVINMFDYSFDVKNYWTLILSWLIIFLFWKIRSTKWLDR